MNISRETKRETKILRIVENLGENCPGKFPGFARKKDDNERFDKQFGERLKLGKRGFDRPVDP